MWLLGFFSLCPASPTRMSSGAFTVRSFVRLAARLEKGFRGAAPAATIPFLHSGLAPSQPGNPAGPRHRPMASKGGVFQLMTDSAVNVNCVTTYTFAPVFAL